MGIAQMRYIFSGTRVVVCAPFKALHDAFKRHGTEIKSTECVKNAFKQLTVEGAKKLIDEGPACHSPALVLAFPACYATVPVFHDTSFFFQCVACSFQLYSSACHCHLQLSSPPRSRPGFPSCTSSSRQG